MEAGHPGDQADRADGWARGDARPGRELHISKSVLIQELQAHLHYQTIKVPTDLPEAEAIAREAADFEIYYTRDWARLQWNAKSGSHDDLIIAIALALYGAAHLSARGPVMVPTLGF